MSSQINFWGAIICSNMFSVALLFSSNDRQAAAFFFAMLVWFAVAGINAWNHYRANKEGEK